MGDTVDHEPPQPAFSVGGDVIWVEDELGVDRLALAILSRDRSLPLVVATSVADEFVLAPGAIAELVDGRALVYAVPNGELTRRLSDRLPPRMGVWGGAMRIWHPGASSTSNVRDHPLLLSRGDGSDASRFRGALTAIPARRVESDLVVGEVVRIAMYGALVRVDGVLGLIHISKLAPHKVKNAGEIVRVGDLVTAKLVAVKDDGHLELSLLADGCGVHRDGVPPLLPITPAETSTATEEFERQIAELSEQLDDALKDRDIALAARRVAHDRAQALAKEVKSLRDQLRHLEQRTKTTAGTADPAAFIAAITNAYHRLYGTTDRAAYPLANITIGPDFLDSLTNLDGIDHQRVVDVCAHICAGRGHTIAGLEVHQLRTSKGGSAAQRTRDDGAKGWRCSLQVQASSARRMHYWILPTSDHPAIELDSVNTHDGDL